MKQAGHKALAISLQEAQNTVIKALPPSLPISLPPALPPSLSSSGSLSPSFLPPFFTHWQSPNHSTAYSLTHAPGGARRRAQKNILGSARPTNQLLSSSHQAPIPSLSCLLFCLLSESSFAFSLAFSFALSLAFSLSTTISISLTNYHSFSLSL